MFVAHTDLGNSYLFNEPRDFTKALEHMQHATALAPDEPWPHDLLGDVYRAQGDLPKAGAEYTRAHELRPTDASPLQQRGHVNSFLGNYAAARADYDSAIALGRANEKGSFAVFRTLVGVHAGEPGAAIAELNQLVASIPQMGTPDPRGTQIFALTTAAVIAIHTRDFAAAEQALRQRATMLRQQADEIGTPAVRRSQEADVAYFEGWLAARRGDYASARTLADSVARLVEPDANPRKMEGVHELRGFIALYQGNAAEAVGHFEQGNPNNTYITYQLALAHEGAGHADQAKRLFRDVASNNFNDVGFALVRKEALQKAS
jgi:tetratricopeptide (TPR) repeat protein